MAVMNDTFIALTSIFTTNIKSVGLIQKSNSIFALYNYWVKYTTIRKCMMKHEARFLLVACQKGRISCVQQIPYNMLSKRTIHYWQILIHSIIFWNCIGSAYSKKKFGGLRMHCMCTVRFYLRFNHLWDSQQ